MVTGLGDITLNSSRKSFALHRQQPVQGRLPLLRRLRHDHLDHDRQALHVVEHALGAAQPDAHGTVLEGPRASCGRVGVGHHLEPGGCVGPAQQRRQLRVKSGLDRRDLAQIDLAVGAVDGDDVTLAEARLTHVGLAPGDIHRDALGTGDAGLAHAARHHGGVGGLAAAGGQDALGGKESVDVLGLGFLAHQDDLLPHVLAQLLGPIGVEHGDAGGGTGRGRQTLGHGLRLDLGVKAREQHLLQEVRLDAQQGLLFADQPLVVHLHRGAHHGLGVHLAVAGLQAEELTTLDGELEVLHLPVVGLQLVAQLRQLPGDLRHLLVQAIDGLGGADAGHHVLTLGVDEVLAEELVLAGARVAGEAHAGSRVVAAVAEHHGHHVDRGTVGLVRRDIELACGNRRRACPSRS